MTPDYSGFYTRHPYLRRNQIPVSHISSGRKQQNVSNHPNHVTRGCHQVHQQDLGRKSVPHEQANNTNVHPNESAMDTNVTESSGSSVSSTGNMSKITNATQNSLSQSSRIPNKKIVPESQNSSAINATYPESSGGSVYDKLSPSRSTINRSASDLQSDTLLPSSFFIQEPSESVCKMEQVGDAEPVWTTKSHLLPCIQRSNQLKVKTRKISMVTYNCYSAVNNSDTIQLLRDKFDILFLQEHWLFQ